MEALTRREERAHVHALAAGELVHDRGRRRWLAQVLDPKRLGTLALLAELLRKRLAPGHEIRDWSGVELVDLFLEVHRFTSRMAR